MNKTVIPYEGDRPYAFVSFAHRDSDEVLSVLGGLQARGYRVWYDDGITPGSEWSENIAKHLSGCAVVLAFVSPNFSASSNCRREVNFALSRDKSVLPIFLRETALPDGLELQLSAQQYVLRYAFATEEKFYHKLSLCEALEVCRGEAVPTAPVTPKKRWWPIAAGAAAVVLAGGLLLGLLTGREPGPQEPETQREETQQPETPPEESPQEQPPAEEAVVLRQIELSGEDMSDAAFLSNTELLKNRLTLLTGGNYTLSVGEKHLSLGIPEEAFGGCDIAAVLRNYITRPINLYLRNAATGEAVAVTRADLASVTLHTGQLPGVDVSGIGIREEEYEYIEIRLTDRFAEANRTFLQAVNLEFAQDADMASYGIYYTYPSVQTGTFYVVNTDPGVFPQLVVQNLQSEPLTEAFSFEIVPDYAWETPADSLVSGENQVAVDQLQGNAVNLVYEYYTELALYKRIEIEESLKKRFDALGQPYAYGQSKDSETSFVFRIAAAHMNEDIAALMCSNNGLCLQNGLARMSLYGAAAEIVEVSRDEYGLLVTVGLGDREKLEAFSAYAVETGRAVELKADSFGDGPRISSAVVTEPVTSDSMVFTGFLPAGLEAVTEETRCLYELIKVMVENGGVSGLELQSVRFDAGEPMLYGYRSDKQTAAAEVKQRVLDTCPENTVNTVYERDNKIWIVLDLPVDELLVETGLTLAKEICINAELERTPFDSLIIALVRENDSEMERFRIIYTKNCDYFSIGDEKPGDGEMYLLSICQNGRMESYREEFEAALQADPFFAALLKE